MFSSRGGGGAHVLRWASAATRDGMVEELRDMSGCRKGVALKFAVRKYKKISVCHTPAACRGLHALDNDNR